MNDHKYKRRYFRIKPDRVLDAQMTISQIESKSIKTGFTSVRIINISPGGLRFSSELKFPVNPDVVLEFSIPVCERTIDIKGHVVYRTASDQFLFEYGVSFTQVDESMHMYLSNLFNNMTLRMQKMVVILKLNQLNS